MNIDIYKENILDLYKNPHNKGLIEKPTHKFLKRNPLCGDEIEIQMIIFQNKIKEIKFSGEACAICTASTSLLTDRVKNLKIEEIKSLTKENILEMLEIPISYMRLKCALLPLETIQSAIQNGEIKK